jgi:O-antigen ligase
MPYEMPYELAPKGFVQRARIDFAAFRKQSLAPVWCGLAALMVAIAWLLPNHTRPWIAFHSDAWMAVMLAIVATVVFVRTREATLSGLDLLLLAAAVVPLLHFGLGLLPFAGQAWIATLYLLGFAVAVMVGRQWNAWQPLVMGDVLFGSFFIAALGSVGLQLYQWFGMTENRGMYDIWVFGLAQTRPYANLGQPNQAATLLLWGLLACGWGRYRGHAGRAVSAAAAAMLVFGLALTQSRTGFLGLCSIVIAAWWWRSLWPDRRMLFDACTLVPWYFVASYGIDWASTALLLDEPSSMISRSVSEVRPALWAMMLDAAAQRPWLGFGWNQVLAAHLALAERHPQLTTLFGHAHNLPLDLVVWAGIPIGLVLTGACAAWAWRAATRLRQPAHLFYFLVLVTVGIHAMLELPLHYAYFLLPAGLAVGALSGDLKIWLLASPGRTAWRAGVLALGATTLLLGLVLRDYFSVETATLNVRMKLARIHSDTPLRPPQLTVLTQFPVLLDISLLEPSVSRSVEELKRARDVTSMVVVYRNLFRLPLLLALNGHTPEARCWMAKASVLVNPNSRQFLLDDWREAQQAYPQLQGIEWAKVAELPGVCDAVRHSPLGPWPQAGL